MRVYLRVKTNAYRHLWIKYVTGFDVAQHCAKCLAGPYSAHLIGKPFKAGLEIDVELDEHPSPYVYICGVTDAWMHNAHMALEPKPGHEAAYEDGNIRVLVCGGRQLPIEAVRAGYPKVQEDCRNWQFGYRYFYEPAQGGLLL